MIDGKLDALRWSLVSKGYEDLEVFDIVNSARQEIILSIEDIVQSAVEEIAQKAGDIDADDFLSQIKLVSNGGYVEISTDSGRTDFSKPAVEMLPSILKNGKTSKSGSIYKVVPIGKNPIEQQQQVLIKNINAGIKAISSKTEKTSLQDAVADMAVSFGIAANSGILNKKIEQQKIDNNISFRTASSKQDPSTSWVIPEKEADMTSSIQDVNNRLRYQTDDIINNIIRKYEREY